ncbi:hypothetical protein TNCV_1956431 [Trichonephila clavipes]|nr:hypothetical protein TNCV_1956431 [Trichonephila clavipes]
MSILDVKIYPPTGKNFEEDGDFGISNWQVSLCFRDTVDLAHDLFCRSSDSLPSMIMLTTDVTNVARLATNLVMNLSKNNITKEPYRSLWNLPFCKFL